MTSPGVDVIVVGGGTAGATLAGLLAASGQVRVLLLEAGPDYGPREAGGWPADLLDARRLPESHGWGYRDLAHRSHQVSTEFDRAKVIGGCSAHNGCVALSGTRADYALWAQQAGPDWAWDSVAPAFSRAKQRLGVTTPALERVQPFQRTFISAAHQSGIALSPDLDDPDEAEGVGASPVNIVTGVRWNSSFAYLDPVRAGPRLRIRANTLMSRVLVDHGRAVGVEIVAGGRTETIHADLVVLASGAYASPAILLRSGIGDPADLAAAGIDPLHDLAGVGRGLTDHPMCTLDYAPSEELEQRMAEAEAAAGSWIPDEQAIAKVQLPGRPEPVAVHLFAWTPMGPGGPGRRAYRLAVSLMAPKSSGWVRLRDADPSTPPVIDHGYLTDPDGSDRHDLAVAVRIGRDVMRHLIETGALLNEVVAIPDDDASLEKHVEAHVSSYFHPASSCRMGTDELAVVDSAGRVRGLDGLRVCDASIFPTLPRANTNLPAAMVAEHLAGSIMGATRP
jgi:choline dehydrogenase